MSQETLSAARKALQINVESRHHGIQNYNKDALPIRSADILARIAAGDASWEKLVPPPVVEIIKLEGLCGLTVTGEKPCVTSSLQR